MDLLVVGAGEMGRWVAETLAPTVESVAFADAERAAASAAAESFDAVDSRAVALETSDAFDVVALAVPMPAVSGAVRQHAPNATGALVDVTGVMETPLAAMDRHAVSEYASFHPLFAPPRAPGRIAYVPGKGGERDGRGESSAVGATVERVRSTFVDAGNDVFETTAEEHDEAMESVQAGAHAAVLSYATATADVDDRFETPISTKLEELAETVTAGDPRVYADIQATFDGADALAAAAEEFADADEERFRELFETACQRVTDGDSGGRRVEPPEFGADTESDLSDSSNPSDCDRDDSP